MEEFAEGDEFRRMQREQERERRRIRDRERRQAMTQEQRERHLARRRRNYQLRRQRAASNAGFIPLPQTQQLLESSAGEASTSDEIKGVTSSTPLDRRALCHGIGLPHQGQETLNLGNIVEGPSVHLETMAYKPANSQRRLRLNHIKHLARSLTSSSIGDPAGTHQVAAVLITKADVSTGDCGSTPRSLRLNRVKRLARSKNSPPKETASLKNYNLTQEGIQLLGKLGSL